MPNALKGYGILMIIIGVAGYLIGGMVHYTALIPAVLGVIAVIAAFSPLKRSVTGIAVIGTVIAALALFGSVSAFADIPAAWAGDPAVNPVAVYARSITAVLSAAIILCLGSLWLRRQRGDGASESA
jgi:hypothetical protein